MSQIEFNFSLSRNVQKLDSGLILFLHFHNYRIDALKMWFSWPNKTTKSDKMNLFQFEFFLQAAGIWLTLSRAAEVSIKILSVVVFPPFYSKANFLCAQTCSAIHLWQRNQCIKPHSRMQTNNLFLYLLKVKLELLKIAYQVLNILYDLCAHAWWFRSHTISRSII